LDRELQISTCWGIAALRLLLGKMSIASSSKDDLVHALTEKSTNASKDEAQKRSSKHNLWHGKKQRSVSLHQGMKEFLLLFNNTLILFSVYLLIEKSTLILFVHDTKIFLFLLIIISFYLFWRKTSHMYYLVLMLVWS
jgi:hypothetical protein